MDDPIVLPKRLASASLDAGVYRTRPNGGTNHYLLPDLSAGLTDRLQWDLLLSFRYALLDDAPGSPLPHAPFALAVRAGFSGVGFGDAEGWLLLPLLSIEARKRLSDRWAISSFVDWSAYWTETSPAFAATTAREYDDLLFPTGYRWSELTVGVSALRQLTERIAAGVTLTAAQIDECTHPFCGWRAREGTATARLLFRPVHWLHLVLAPTMGERYRPTVLAMPSSPTGDTAVPPKSVTWLGLTGSLTLLW